MARDGTTVASDQPKTTANRMFFIDTKSFLTPAGCVMLKKSAMLQ
jgi:hypothetical protein